MIEEQRTYRCVKCRDVGTITSAHVEDRCPRCGKGGALRLVVPLAPVSLPCDRLTTPKETRALNAFFRWVDERGRARHSDDCACLERPGIECNCGETYR